MTFEKILTAEKKKQETSSTRSSTEKEKKRTRKLAAHSHRNASIFFDSFEEKHVFIA